MSLPFIIKISYSLKTLKTCCFPFMHLFYSLCCNDLYCPCTSKTCLDQFWLKEHLIPSMVPLKWRNIHDLYTTDNSLIRTLCSVPSVSVLERFDCKWMHAIAAINFHRSFKHWRILSRILTSSCGDRWAAAVLGAHTAWFALKLPKELYKWFIFDVNFTGRLTFFANLSYEFC